MREFFFCLLFVCQVFGVVYDDETVAELITVITSTSLIPSAPSTKHLYPAQKSLFQVPALARCKKIIVFDGLQKGQKKSAKVYEEYKRNVLELTKSDPYFANTELVFCPKWGHLAGAIREAMRHVKTPFVFIHQHDLILLREFDLNGVIASMVANPAIRCVMLGRRPLMPDDHYHGPVVPVEEGHSLVPLCYSCGWSDQCHVSTVDYYQTFVLPQCQFTFMEYVLHPALRKAVRKDGLEGRIPFGTYLYGNLLDGPFIEHTNGRFN